MVSTIKWKIYTEGVQEYGKIFGSILTKSDLCQYILVKVPNMKLLKNPPPSKIQAVQYRQHLS